MTRKNSTVNPKAGTLKQQNRALRTSSQPGFVKSIAFALLLSLTIPSLSIAKDELADTGKDVKARVDRSIPDSCCVADKVQSKNVYKIVRLVIPSKEMIRKSDSEANHNLVRSLKESKLTKLHAFILRSDRDIHNRFAAETRIGKVGNSNAADTDISIHFNAENLPVHAQASIASGDEEINEFFKLDNEGLHFAGLNSLKADQDINQQFVVEHARISVPSAAHYWVADQEMAVPARSAGQSMVSNSKY
jgi:hypothetical protein